ncbi:hypothetical protein TWF481_002754 [Arthrobotrys musiformis]|uniref:Uncharacterized protein n=1 Tax=Arthrobotrys musiformis TaxID=47236 RepID=A0AAV9VSC1_9PEZI
MLKDKRDIIGEVEGPWPEELKDMPVLSHNGDEAPDWFRNEYANLVLESADVFSWSAVDLGHIVAVKHAIDVISDKDSVMKSM